MALLEAYEYLDKNNLLEFDKEEDIIRIAEAQFKIGNANISMSLESVLEEVKEDISIYGKSEPCWLYFEESKNLLIPSDYLLIDKDVLDEDSIHIECSLEDVLKVFELVDSIL